MPEYADGTEQMWKFLIENLKYPQEAEKAKISDRVYVRFIVEKDGSLSDAKVVKSGHHAALDAEALHVVKLMGRWTPAKVKGKVVRSYFVIPVQFRFK